MSETSILIFSKDRTLQLKSLLLSLRELTDIDETKITVLYVATEGFHYEHLIQEFSCQFVPQKSFLEDVRHIIQRFETSFVSFMVDDLIIRDEISFRFIENYLTANKDTDVFSLRLGENIKDSKTPLWVRKEEGVRVWDTDKRWGLSWNYFWELSSSVYRKETVLKYLNKCRQDRETFPNPLEEYYYEIMPSYVGGGWTKLKNKMRCLFRPKKNRLACFEMSKCFTQGVNMVATRNIDYNMVYDPKVLDQKMLEGFIVDFKNLKEVPNKKPNAGAEFFNLVKQNG